MAAAQVITSLLLLCPPVRPADFLPKMTMNDLSIFGTRPPLDQLLVPHSLTLARYTFLLGCITVLFVAYLILSRGFKRTYSGAWAKAQLRSHTKNDSKPRNDATSSTASSSVGSGSNVSSIGRLSVPSSFDTNKSVDDDEGQTAGNTTFEMEQMEEDSPRRTVVDDDDQHEGQEMEEDDGDEEVWFEADYHAPLSSRKEEAREEVEVRDKEEEQDREQSLGSDVEKEEDGFDNSAAVDEGEKPFDHDSDIEGDRYSISIIGDEQASGRQSDEYGEGVDYSCEVTPDEKRSLLVLVSIGVVDRFQACNQRRALMLLDARRVPYETVDAMDPAQHQIRNDLFALSGINSVSYPQFFFVGDGTISYVGDWNKLESLNEASDIPEDILSDHPEIETWERVFKDVVAPSEITGG